MAITVTTSAAGAGNQSASATLVLTVTTADILPGDVIIVAIAADNAGAAGISAISSVQDSKSNSWAAATSTPLNRTPGAAANDGTTLGFYICRVTAAMIAATDTITINFSPNVTAKAARYIVLRGSEDKAFTSSTAMAASATYGSITSGSLAVGDIIIGAVASESNTAPTNDTDVTNGAWVGATQVSGGGGADATKQAVLLSYKIVTGTGTQTFNGACTNSDHAEVINGFTVPVAKSADDPAAGVDAGTVNTGSQLSDTETGAAVDTESLTTIDAIGPSADTAAAVDDGTAVVAVSDKGSQPGTFGALQVGAGNATIPNFSVYVPAPVAGRSRSVYLVCVAEGGATFRSPTLNGSAAHGSSGLSTASSGNTAQTFYWTEAELPATAGLYTLSGAGASAGVTGDVAVFSASVYGTAVPVMSNFTSDGSSNLNQSSTSLSPRNLWIGVLLDGAGTEQLTPAGGFAINPIAVSYANDGTTAFLATASVNGTSVDTSAAIGGSRVSAGVMDIFRLDVMVITIEGEVGAGVDAGGTIGVIGEDDPAAGADAGESIAAAVAGGDDPVAAVDAGESLAATLTDDDPAAAVDAGENVDESAGDVPISDSDTASGDDAGESLAATISGDDPATGDDAGESLADALANDDTGTAADAGESLAVAVTGGDDPGAGADAGESIAAATTDPDTGAGTDAGESLTNAVNVDDPAAGVDAGEALAATVAGGDDPAAAVDTEGLAEYFTSDDPATSDEADAVAATLADDDTGDAADGAYYWLTDDEGGYVLDEDGNRIIIHGYQELIDAALTDDDTATDTEAGSIAAALTSTDTGTGADADSLSNTITDPDTCAVLDAGSLAATTTDPDTASGDDAAVSVALSSPDTSAGDDAGEALAATLTDTDSGDETDDQSVDKGDGTLTLSSSDTGSTDDSEYIDAALTDPDTSASDDAEALAVALSNTDLAAGVDAEAIAALTTDPDTGAITDQGAIAAANTDVDTGTATDDNVLTVLFSDDDTASETETETVLAAITSNDSASVAELAGAILATLTDADDAIGVDEAEFIAIFDDEYGFVSEDGSVEVIVSTGDHPTPTHTTIIFRGPNRTSRITMTPTGTVVHRDETTTRRVR